MISSYYAKVYLFVRNHQNTVCLNGKQKAALRLHSKDIRQYFNLLVLLSHENGLAGTQPKL